MGYAFRRQEALRDSEKRLVLAVSQSQAPPGLGQDFGARRNVARDPRVCIYAVNPSRRLWLGLLIRGRARRAQAVRLIARVGERREATAGERQRWLNKVSSLRWTRGYRYLWSDMKHARDLEGAMLPLSCRRIRLLVSSRRAPASMSDALDISLACGDMNLH